MSEEVNKQLYAHYKAVIAGSHSTGNSVSNELIVSDARKNLADLVKKNPDTDFGNAPTVEQPSEPKEPKAKSKRKR